ncbi:MAG: VOC family protein [Terriglobales bacterium]
MRKGPIPGLTRVDHVALTVPDLDAAVRFYSEVIGGSELYRLAPFDAADLSPMPGDPIYITEAFYDMRMARELIAKLTGRSWIWSAIRGRVRIAKAQIRQRLGLPSGHPGTGPVPPELRFWSQETTARSPAIASGK